MNKLTIIGNLTADPELRSTPSGVSVCTFTVAVNSRQKDATDFFRVSAWRQLGESCSRFLAKGKKVAVVGEVTARAFEGKDGSLRARMEVTASEVEFLSPKSEDKPVDRSSQYDREQREAAKRYAEDAEFEEITDGDLPF